MAKQAAPILFGRRMKRTSTLIGSAAQRWYLDLGDFRFCVDYFAPKTHRALVLFLGYHASSGDYRSQPAALRSLVQMRISLVKSLTPEGR